MSHIAKNSYFRLVSSFGWVANGDYFLNNCKLNFVANKQPFFGQPLIDSFSFFPMQWTLDIHLLHFLSQLTPMCWYCAYLGVSVRLSAYRIHNLYALSASAGWQSLSPLSALVLPIYHLCIPLDNSRNAHSVVTCDCFISQPHGALLHI